MDINTIRQEITKERERVVFLYNRSESCVNSDKELLQQYEEVFGKIIELNKVATIKRVGRDLRRKYPDRFKRKESKLQIDKQLETLNRTEFWKSKHRHQENSLNLWDREPLS